MTADDGELVDWSAFQTSRAQLGSGFARILGYFREDGVKSIGAIESAMRDKSAIALINPAHMLKGEAYQFGAVTLAELAETIEITARQCVERHMEPDELIEHAVKLRPVFEKTLEMLEREASPLVERRRTFGQSSAMPPRTFGRLQG